MAIVAKMAAISNKLRINGDNLLETTLLVVNLVLDDRLTNFIPVTHITGEVNRDGIRKMTPREWARLQGFPDDFKIIVSDAQAYKQFGNSVAVPAIQATAQQILKSLNI